MHMKRFKKEITNNPDVCISCGLCTKHCQFLDKYHLNLLNFSKRKDLAYNCFLCDKCYEVCPKDIKGSDISLNLRSLNPQTNKILNYKKIPYIFSNNSSKNSKELMFFGCNFPGYFPKTTEKIINLFEQYNIDFSIDCCGKPVYETSLKFDEIKNHLIELFKTKGVETLITACPNCYHFLKDKLNIKIISLYEKLDELGLLKQYDEEINMFFPCPERTNNVMFQTFNKKLPNLKDSFSDVNCCGAGGFASKNEPEIAKSGAQEVAKRKVKNLYTYCATCGGMFAKNGAKPKHIASLFLEVDEIASKNYLYNVTKFKFYKKGRK